MPDEVGPPLRLRTAPHQAPALGLGLVASSTYGQLGSNSAKLLPATVLRRGWRFFFGSSDAAPGRRNPKRHDLSNKCTLDIWGSQCITTQGCMSLSPDSGAPAAGSPGDAPGWGAGKPSGPGAESDPATTRPAYNAIRRKREERQACKATSGQSGQTCRLGWRSSRHCRCPAVRSSSSQGQAAQPPAWRQTGKHTSDTLNQGPSCSKQRSPGRRGAGDWRASRL